jgi:hypothetical protein
MRNSTKDLLVGKASERFKGKFVRVVDLSKQAGIGYMDTWRTVQRLKLACISNETLICMSYQTAVAECAKRSPDGLVTFTDVARERRAPLATVHGFFFRNPELKERWGVMTRSEVLKSRFLAAVSRLRNGDPHAKVTRKMVAKELGWNPNSLVNFLVKNPGLLKEAALVAADLKELNKDIIAAHKKKYYDAAASFRAKNPGAELTALALAAELGCPVKTVWAYLARRRELIDELGVVYSVGDVTGKNLGDNLQVKKS